MDNYYKIIGVKDFASLDEIKTTYRKLSKKFHQDMNEGDKFFEERFKEIQNAYEVLTDSSRKIIHDTKLRNRYMQDQHFHFSGANNASNNKQQNQSENATADGANQTAGEATGTKDTTRAEDAGTVTRNTSGTPKVEESASSETTSSFRGGLLVIGIVIVVILIFVSQMKSSNTDSNTASNNSNTYNSTSTSPQYTVPSTPSTYSSRDYSPSNDNVLYSKSDNFTLGSSKARVLKVQGNPTSIYKFGMAGEEMWLYGTSSVTFRKGKVSEYSNSGSNLNVTVSLPEKNLNTDNDALSSSPQIFTSETTASTKKHKSNTKWLYFSCLLSDFDHLTHYYSKIYEVNNYTENKGLKIKNCLIEQLKFFNRTEEPIFLVEHEYNSFSDASETWNLESGKKIIGDGSCYF